jgi:tricorn protease
MVPSGLHTPSGSGRRAGSTTCGGRGPLLLGGLISPLLAGFLPLLLAGPSAGQSFPSPADTAAAGFRVPVYGPGPGAEALPVIDHVDPEEWGSVEEGRGFYRDPALHGDVLVFQAEGDLWRVPLYGGVARRLTTHPGVESHPVISPDGRTLAFTARYEGPTELYTMPLDGGVTTRRTWQGDASLASAFLPDGRLVYTTRAYSTLPRPQLVALELESGAEERIPLHEATEPAFDDSGETLFFVRPAFHNNVTKRYIGGTARDIWRFDLGAAWAPDEGGGEPGTTRAGVGALEAVELTGDWVGESHSPMIHGERVYFVTDRDGTMNLWSMDAEGGDLRQHTRHSGMDVRDPVLSEGVIVYNVGADLWRFEVGSASAPERIDITLSSDFDQLRETWETDPADHLTSVHLHPEGSHLVLTARGRLFVAPAVSGRLVRLDHDDGVRYRDARFSADGRHVLALSDETGELEIVRLPADGIGESEALTSNGSVLRFDPIPSPDGSWIAWTDNDAQLRVMRADGSEERRITTDEEGVGDLAWSPDGRWLAYSKAMPNTFQRVEALEVESGRVVPLTTDRVNSVSPAWSRDGTHLYYLSDRNLRSVVSSPWGPRAPEPYIESPMELYVVALRDGGDTPFRPENELMAGEGGAATGADSGAGAAGSGSSGAGNAAPEVRIDAAGLLERTWRVPVEAGSHAGLSAGDGVLFWHDDDPDGPGRILHALKIERGEPEVVTVAEGIGGYELSVDGEHLMVARRGSFSVVPARAAPADLAEGAVDLDGWAFSIDPRQDWRQIFVDAWRLERDWFYDPDMHGVDWRAVRDRYLPLVERVTTRDELSDVIGQAVGELSALHTSVRGGEMRAGPEDVDVASLGAHLVRDAGAGGYRIATIYRHDPDYPAERGPLVDPALGIEEGDVIVAVNGRSPLEAGGVGALLREQAGRQVLLSLRPGEGGEIFEAVVEPAGSAYGLRYTHWEVTRRRRVEEAGAGRLGYVHVRAMGGGNLTEWYRQFFPVFAREGLIIDMRTNRGGNIDAILLNDLIKEAWMYWKRRAGEPYWNMQYAPVGHMVVLVDQSTASDGEAFAEGFRRMGLGPVIGTRTWGGEIWLSSVNTLSDGGLARAPMMGSYGADGAWLIEQIGVIPDIVVDNLPHATFNGEDAQLDAGVAWLLQRLDEAPVAVPDPPAYPDLRFDYPRRGGGGDGEG